MQHLAPPPTKRIISASKSFNISMSCYLLFCSAATTAKAHSNELDSPDGSPANQTGLSLWALPEADTKIMGPKAYTSLQNRFSSHIPLNRVIAMLEPYIGVGISSD